MTKLPFEWPHPGDPKAVDEVVLETTTIERMVALMARAMVAVVRTAEHTEEAADER